MATHANQSAKPISGFGPRMWIAFSLCLLIGSLLIYAGSLSEAKTSGKIFPHNTRRALTDQDTDRDLLPKKFEELLGTDSSLSDTDGDTFCDGIEYILRSNPLNSNDFPTLQPGMRVASYMQQDIIKLCIMFYPGDVALVDDFFFYVGHETGGGGGGGSQGSFMKPVDLTMMIALGISEVNHVSFRGETLSSYVINIPRVFLQTYSPLSIGVGLNIIGVPLVDVIDLDMQDDVIVSLQIGMTDGLQPGEAQYTILSETVPNSWDDSMVCQTQMVLISTEGSISTYEVDSASCTRVLRQNCSPTKCGALVGEKVKTLDPDYIYSQVE